MHGPRPRQFQQPNRDRGLVLADSVMDAGIDSPLLELTAQLVAIDSRSPNPGERELAGFIASRALERGYAVSRLGDPQRPSLLISADVGSGGSIALCGHLDTKPVGDVASDWETNPFQLTIIDGAAYGLGTVDMKGAVAAMLIALDEFVTAPGSVGRAHVVLTADEECGSVLGAQLLAEQGLLPDIDGMVIGEPSGITRSWEAMHLVSRGMACFTIEISTEQGHSGLSELLAPSAISMAANVIASLSQLQDRLPSHPYRATINPAVTIQGGVGFGVHPGRCTISGEVRLVPGMERHELQQLLVSAVLDAAGPYGAVTLVDGPLGWRPATSVDPDEGIVHVAADACRRVLGHVPPHAAYPGGTDAVFLTGVGGIPAIASLGPGLLTAAHRANEHVPLADLAVARRLYAQILAIGGARLGASRRETP